MRRKKAFSILEYTLVIAAVAAAIIAMQVYFKRAVCGKFKGAIDVYGGGRQY
jgi:Flp pilus assembly pilin Flp